MKSFFCSSSRFVLHSKSQLILSALLLIIVNLIYFLKIPVMAFPDTFTYDHFQFSSLQAWYGGPRPFVYPLIFKLLQNNYHVIVFTQYLVSTISAIYFLQVYLDMFQSRGGKFFCVLLLICLASPGFLFWGAVLYTDSFNFSFWLLLFAFGACYIKNQKKRYLAYMIVMILALAFIRYFNVILLASLLPLYLFILLKFKAKGHYCIVLTLATLVICGSSYYAMNLGRAHTFSFGSIISTRVMTQRDHSMLDLFKKNGFPVQEVEKLDFEKDSYAVPHANNRVINRWIDEQGRSIYLKYLATHPGYLFLPLDIGKIHKAFDSKSRYMGEPSIYGAFRRTLTMRYGGFYPIPRYHLELWAALTILIAIFFSSLDKRSLLDKCALKNTLFHDRRFFFLCGMGIYFCLVALATGLLSWHLDSMEVERHSMISAFFFFFGFSLMAANCAEKLGILLANHAGKWSAEELFPSKREV